MEKFGLIGEKLGHSFSKEIHDSFEKYNYDLIEIPKSDVSSFFTNKNFRGINVTIPYKQECMKYLDFINKKAELINAVNTVVNVNDKLYGFNTDYYGLQKLIVDNDIVIKGKKVAILGTGGTSKTAFYVAKDLGAKSVIRVGRKPKEEAISYEDLYQIKDEIEVVINTTPVGMYPNNNESPIDLNDYKNIESVIDVIYNPINTKLTVQAKELGKKAVNGLYMLVMQAICASFVFELALNNDEETLEESINNKDYFEEAMSEFIVINKEKTYDIYNKLMNEKLK